MKRAITNKVTNTSPSSFLFLIVKNCKDEQQQYTYNQPTSKDEAKNYENQDT